MIRIILKVDIHTEKQKIKVLRAVTLPGIVGSDINMKEKKLTVIGEVDPGKVWMKLKWICHSTIISVEEGFEEREKEEEEQRLKEQEEKIREEVEQNLYGMGGINYHQIPYQAPCYSNSNPPYRYPYPTLW